MKLPNIPQATFFGNFRIAKHGASDYPEPMSRDAFSELLAANLSRLLKERDLSALALAERCGLGRSSVYDILDGRSASPKVATVAKMAAGLNVPISDMFLTQEQLEAQTEMLRAYNLLPPEEQKRLAQVVRAWHLD